MPTIAHLVEKNIREKPFLQEALSRGIVNNAALAEELIPLLEDELRTKVKFSAVNMAIRRLSEKLKKNFVGATHFSKKSDLTLKSNLVEIVLYKTNVTQLQLQKIQTVVNVKSGDFLTITQGLHEIMIITNDRHKGEILKKIPSEGVKKVIENLSSVSISIPEEAVSTLGLFYLATRTLNWENINIIDIVSTYTEMTFILQNRDTARAYTTLQSLINNKES